MNSNTTIRENMAGLGWYIRRTADSVALAEWYGGGLGLPLIRGRHPVWFYWAGDALCFELKSDVAPHPARHKNPTTAPMIPVFATSDLDKTLARLKAVNTDVGEIDANDYYVFDSDDQIVVIRQALSNLKHDPRAAQVGASPMPEDLPAWGWTMCHVPDLAAEVEFFNRVCGFPIVSESADGVTLNIGGDTAPGSLLELKPGGEMLTIPSTREERTDAIIFRVDNHDAVNTALKAAGMPIVNDKIQFNSASLTYAASPSGRLVGFEQRFEPHQYKVPRREFLEDKLAILRRKTVKNNA